MKKIAISFSVPTLTDVRSLVGNVRTHIATHAEQRAQRKELASLEAALKARRTLPACMSIKSLEAKIKELTEALPCN